MVAAEELVAAVAAAEEEEVGMVSSGSSRNYSLSSDLGAELEYKRLDPQEHSARHLFY